MGNFSYQSQWNIVIIEFDWDKKGPYICNYGQTIDKKVLTCNYGQTISIFLILRIDLKWPKIFEQLWLNWIFTHKIKYEFIGGIVLLLEVLLSLITNICLVVLGHKLSIYMLNSFLKFQVNQALIDLINASEKKISPQDWTNLPQTSSGKHTTNKIVSLFSMLCVGNNMRWSFLFWVFYEDKLVLNPVICSWIWKPKSSRQTYDNNLKELKSALKLFPGTKIISRQLLVS